MTRSETSTKAIREALAMLTTVRDGQTPSTEAILKAQAAEQELKAIEQAAETVTDCFAPLDQYRGSEGVKQARKTMRAVGDVSRQRRWRGET